MPEPGPRMNGFSLGELCWLFCCPPCPSRIAAKLAFLPPEPTYTVLAPEQRGPGAPAPASAAAATAAAAAAAATAAAQPAPQQPEEGAGAGPGACSLHLSERADWQYSQRELDAVEVFFSRTARDNRLGCMFVRCAPSSRYTLLFSHGNAVDLGQMCSFYIGLGSRINCNIFSYDYSGYGVSSGKPSEKNLYADIDAAWQALRTRILIPVPAWVLKVLCPTYMRSTSGAPACSALPGFLLAGWGWRSLAPGSLLCIINASSCYSLVSAVTKQFHFRTKTRVPICPGLKHPWHAACMKYVHFRHDLRDTQCFTSCQRKAMTPREKCKTPRSRIWIDMWILRVEELVNFLLQSTCYYGLVWPAKRTEPAM
ncbi:alpha/beta hydrolase domain-containing protein 17C isoform X1 [Hippopotamus amphibius kiboko]|uniref:alpha/beta hydrolase domain-containing protein 17C isoform X1 n=1 Tax=Hippopotamus amphibius kiboko TaxID=575201 RepID=UPI00259A29CB|nr:alpha/beta hydrolase domain-containing protein 17C isoform X1 [Hippopotamus amphibius kiboko]